MSMNTDWKTIPGPWQGEPDRVEFEHAGLPCLLRRSDTSGSWCGYAAVPPGHPVHGKGYDVVPVEVHGGLTYADACQGDICHVPKPGGPDDVWWLGFDCNHAWDLCPLFAALKLFGGGSGPTYRDVAYVRAETERLATQLAALTP